jgi:hypothetical protein
MAPVRQWFRDGLTGRFISKRRAGELSTRRVNRERHKQIDPSLALVIAGQLVIATAKGNDRPQDSCLVIAQVLANATDDERVQEQLALIGKGRVRRDGPSTVLTVTFDQHGFAVSQPRDPTEPETRG